MVNARWREQYEDAVSTHLRAQEVAGLDICTDYPAGRPDCPARATSLNPLCGGLVEAEWSVGIFG